MQCLRVHLFLEAGNKEKIERVLLLLLMVMIMTMIFYNKN
jgi:hypothetical protein